MKAILLTECCFKMLTQSVHQQSAMQMNRCRHLVPLYPYHATNYNYYNLITFNCVLWSVSGSSQVCISRSRHFSTLNISETKRDRAIVTIERQLSHMCSIISGCAVWQWNEHARPYQQDNSDVLSASSASAPNQTSTKTRRDCGAGFSFGNLAAWLRQCRTGRINTLWRSDDMVIIFYACD